LDAALVIKRDLLDSALDIFDECLSEVEAKA